MKVRGRRYKAVDGEPCDICGTIVTVTRVRRVRRVDCAPTCWRQRSRMFSRGIPPDAMPSLPDPRTTPRVYVTVFPCGDCGRQIGSIAQRGGDVVLTEPDHCGWCGRAKSNAAKQLEEALARPREDRFLIAGVAV